MKRTEKDKKPVDWCKVAVSVGLSVVVVVTIALVGCLIAYENISLQTIRSVTSAVEGAPAGEISTPNRLPAEQSGRVLEPEMSIAKGSDSEATLKESQESVEANAGTSVAGVSLAIQKIWEQAGLDQTITAKAAAEQDAADTTQETPEMAQASAAETTIETEQSNGAKTEDGESKTTSKLIYGSGYVEKGDFAGRFKDNLVLADTDIDVILRFPDDIFKQGSVNQVKVVYPAKIKKGETASIKVLVTAENGQQYFVRVKLKAKENLTLGRGYKGDYNEFDSVMPWNGTRLTLFFYTSASKKQLKLPAKAKYKTDYGVLKCTFVRQKAEK